MALGESLGQVVEQIGTTPQVAVVMVAGTAAPHLAEIVDAVHTLLCPDVLVGAVGPELIPNAQKADQPEYLGSGERERHEHGAAVALWSGNPGAVRPVRIPAHGQTSPGFTTHSAHELLIGFELASATANSGREPVSGVWDGERCGPVAMARLGVSDSTTRESSRPRLWLDEEGFVDGTVGFAVDGSRARVVVAQGFRPIAEPVVITEMADARVAKLAGELASHVLADAVDGLSSYERALARRGLFMGIVTNEHADDLRPEDFAVCGIEGTTNRGLVVLGSRLANGHDPVGDERPATGSLVQFHVSDQRFGRFELDSVGVAGRVAPGILAMRSGVGPGVDMGLFHDSGPEGFAGLTCSQLFSTVRGKNEQFDNATSVVLFD